MFVCQMCLNNYEGSAVEYAEARGFVSQGRCEDCGDFHACYELYSGSPGLKRKAPTVSPIQAVSERPRIEWPDPTPEMLQSPQFNAVWNCIKTWDISVPDAYAGYEGATGNHVRAILDALAKIKEPA